MAEAEVPEDADSWTDEQWIEWLAATDAPADQSPENIAPRKARSVGTQMLASLMLGFHEMFYGRQDDQQVQVAPSPDPLDEDEDLMITLDPDVPANSEVRIRP